MLIRMVAFAEGAGGATIEWSTASSRARWAVLRATGGYIASSDG